MHYQQENNSNNNVTIWTKVFVIALLLFGTGTFIIGFSLTNMAYVNEQKNVSTNVVTLTLTNYLTVQQSELSIYSNLLLKTEYIIKSDGAVVPDYMPALISNVCIYSITNALDPELLLSLIQTESYYNRLCHNSYGAKGLTQIVPSLMKEFMKAHNIKNYQVYWIGANICMGSAQLRWFIDDADGSVAKALYRYNGVVVRKLNGNKVSLPDEGYRYLIKMMDTYYRYKQLEVK